MDMRRKLYTGKVIDAPSDGPIVAVVSTDEVDYAGDILVQGKNEKGDGWLLDDYNSRGRVYWMHDPFRPNLANATAAVDDGRLLLKVQFDEADPFAAEIARKYREGFLSEWSVGFRPVEGKYEPNEQGGFTFYEQQLDEVSAVNQGMNPGTRTVSKAYAEYVDMAAEVAMRLDQYEQRLRVLEGEVMRAARSSEDRAEKVVLDALKELDRVRTHA
jgi:HK97 family phage prohead protease